MALNPNTFQQTFDRGFLDWVFVENRGDDEAKNQNNEDPPRMDFHRRFCQSYKAYADEGEIIGVVIANQSSAAANAMESVIRKSTGSSMSQAKIWGRGFATFWSLIVGIPTQDLGHGGIAPAGVINTAAGLASAYEAAILSVRGSSPNDWTLLIEAVERVTKTIIWSVTELFTCGPSVCPITFPEIVS